MIPHTAYANALSTRMQCRGASEARTETYKWYVEGVLELATLQCAENRQRGWLRQAAGQLVRKAV